MNNREEEISQLVQDCFIAHQEIILIKLIVQLEKEYKEIAQLSTLGEYNPNWTHKEVLDYITYNT